MRYFRPLVSAVLDEVVRPDVVGVRGPQTEARAVRQPETAAPGLFSGTFSPSRRQIRSTRLSFTKPAGATQQRRDLAVAIAAVLSGKLNGPEAPSLYPSS